VQFEIAKEDGYDVCIPSCSGYNSTTDMPQGHDAIMSKIMTLESVTVEPTA
jgi:hypothetical protein